MNWVQLEEKRTVYVSDTGKEYSGYDLVVSTLERIDYNQELAAGAILAEDSGEAARFNENARMMLDDIDYAMENNDFDILVGNRDW